MPQKDECGALCITVVVIDIYLSQKIVLVALKNTILGIEGVKRYLKRLVPTSLSCTLDIKLYLKGQLYLKTQVQYLIAILQHII